MDSGKKAIMREHSAAYNLAYTKNEDLVCPGLNLGHVRLVG